MTSKRRTEIKIAKLLPKYDEAVISEWNKRIGKCFLEDWRDVTEIYKLTAE